MILDTLDFPPNRREIETDVCIVGSGPAALVIARELSSSRARVTLLESGALRYEAAAQELNGGRIVGGPYADLRSVRLRQVGGTVNAWNTDISGRPGAKYAPLDALDFEAREGLPNSGWPISYAELEPWYRKAQGLCGLGVFDYGAARWAQPNKMPLPLEEGLVTTRIYQFGTDAPFLDAGVALLRSDNHVQLIQHATVVELVSRDNSRTSGTKFPERVACAVVAVPTRAERIIVRAEKFVLAGGAIENARLLLSSEGPAGVLGNEHDLVGRYFMEHPRDYSLTLAPARSSFIEEAAFYDQHPSCGGTVVMGRLAVATEALCATHSLQASATLIPEARPHSAWTRAVRRLRFSRRVERRPPDGYPLAGAGWSRRQVSQPVRMRLLLNLEQAPAAQNRIVLGRDVDAFGRRRAELHWRWTDAEQQGLVNTRQRFADAFEMAGHGRVHIDETKRQDPNAHHHAGTTRMHSDPRSGVVDADCRVHAVENLYVAGASVFPSAGVANPMLTIVALAARLADHLAERKPS